MQKYNFAGKKIGIWGSGIVGKSAIEFFKQEKSQIQLLHQDKNILIDSEIEQIEQTPASTHLFFEYNDYILPSPGIPLHNYSAFNDKIITEVDILQDRYRKPIIAITGTAGKTTVTHLLQKILNLYKPTVAAGNIGYPMLNLLTKDHGEKLAVIELSSFQLQHAQHFAPDLAIITNFFQNHLDYHSSEKEYLDAKINIFKNQKSGQKRLLPSSLSSQKNAAKSDLFLFGEKPFHKAETQTFYIENKEIIFENTLTKSIMCNTDLLPSYTFPENWLVIVAALHLNGITLDQALCEKLHTFTLPDHRLAPIATINGSTFYNDSKSTIWQSTAQAIDQVKKPISLFLGGLSKNVDRSPLIKKIAETGNITVFAFGREAGTVEALCSQENIKVFSAASLEESFQQCINNISEPGSVLFSPGGSSYDLFKNFETRGRAFEQLVHDYQKQ
jgi:UDP-N-acetylmuramoylalanine--D-glutamate ligase